MSLAIQHGFCEVVLLFFFLLVCEILSPVCPPKISFKNLHIDIQYFIQQKYHLRGQINILHRNINLRIPTGWYLQYCHGLAGSEPTLFYCGTFQYYPHF